MHPDPTCPSLNIRVLLVDDHPAVRQGLALLLAPEGIEVCAEAEGCTAALGLLDHARPHVVLVDLSLGGEDGCGLLGTLQARGLPSLVYSMHEDAHHVSNAFAAGAMGYVTKREVHRILVQAIREVAAGRRFVSQNAALALAGGAGESPPADLAAALSEQERQVFRLLGEGEGTIEIAASLGISPRTVESYFARTREKLGVDDMHELRRHAIAYNRDRND
jgi:DNA-binding NarL/FixJ family response regulator